MADCKIAAGSRHAEYSSAGRNQIAAFALGSSLEDVAPAASASSIPLIDIPGFRTPG